MEIQFDKIPVEYLQKLNDGLRTQEQTLEVRLSEGMPDIGRVLGAWGQVIVRGKEWNGDHMAVSCGVMAWVLYTPEDEEGVRNVEAWLPFTMKWDLPNTPHDGKILISCQLKSVDARSTSARKLMIRATLGVVGEAWLSCQTQVSVPGELPEDVELLTATYPIMLPREAGEKAFQIEEDITTTGPKPEKLLYYCLQPELLDKKVMSGKVVFRGSAQLHVLYRGEDGNLYTWDYDLPFSQYGDMEGEYDQDSTVSVRLCVTGLDVVLDENGSLQAKVGLLGQYLLFDRTMVTVAEDAYSPHRQLHLQQEQLELPSVLDQTTQIIHAEQDYQSEVQQIVDLTFYPFHGQSQRTDIGIELSVSGQFQMLYYDTAGELHSAVTPWEGNWNLQTAQDTAMDTHTFPIGKSQAIPGAGRVNLRADVGIDGTISSGQGMPILTGMELEELKKPDPNRPSLLLCRKGNQRLWDVAKKTGSTVDTIMESNHLETEPEDNRVLLIPIK